MNKNIVTAGVNINVSGSTSSRTSGKASYGGNKSEKILGDLLKEFKTGNRMADSMAKKALSGFGGGAAGGSSLLGAVGSTAATGIGATIAGMLGLTALAGSVEKPEGDFAAFKKAIIDGEEKVVKMNQLTGEVDEVLTMREAIERGIMDGAGNIRAKYKVNTKAMDDITKNLEKQGEYLVLSSSQLDEISSEQGLQLLYDKDITLSKKVIAEKLAKEAGRVSDVPSTLTKNSDIPSSAVSAVGGDGSTIYLAPPSASPVNTSNNIDSLVKIEQEKQESSGSVYLDLLTSGGLFGGNQ